MSQHPSPSAARPVEGNSMGLAGFIISLVGLVASCGLLSPIGLIFSLLGLKREPKGLAIAGVVLGLVGSLWVLVVIFFIGAATVLGVVAAALGMGRYGEFGLDAVRISIAVHEYADQHGSPPQALSDLTGLSAETIQDKWGRPYRFVLAEDKRSYRLISDGPDRTPDTPDDISLSMDVERD